MEKNIELCCGNLLFRLPTQTDVASLVALKNNKVAARLLGGNTPTYTYDGISKWVDSHNANMNEILFVVVDTNRNKIIGHVGLYNIDNVSRQTEYGILLADDESRGKGYGTRCTMTMVNFASNYLKVHKITAEIRSENKASEAMLKKCGFKTDGILRDQVYKNNQYYDVLAMSILSSEWQIDSI